MVHGNLPVAFQRRSSRRQARQRPTCPRSDPSASAVETASLGFRRPGRSLRERRAPFAYRSVRSLFAVCAGILTNDSPSRAIASTAPSKSEASGGVARAPPGSLPMPTRNGARGRRHRKLGRAKSTRTVAMTTAQRSRRPRSSAGRLCCCARAVAVRSLPQHVPARRRCLSHGRLDCAGCCGCRHLTVPLVLHAASALNAAC